MDMADFCKYKDSLGRPNEGLHSYRIGGFAIFDIILTLILALIISDSIGSSLLATGVGLIILFLYTVMGRQNEAASVGGFLGSAFAHLSAHVRNTTLLASLVLAAIAGDGVEPIERVVARARGIQFAPIGAESDAHVSACQPVPQPNGAQRRPGRCCSNDTARHRCNIGLHPKGWAPLVTHRTAPNGARLILIPIRPVCPVGVARRCL